MKMKILSLLTVCFLVFPAVAQSDSSPESYRDFPIIITLQFHSLTLPFKDIATNFKNIGIGIGTEVSYNGKHNWAQQISAVWYRNRAVGNGLLFYTQAAWRPAVASEFYTELKIGAGYLISFRPVESYKRINDKWVSVGHKGKGMLVLPIGVSVGYSAYSASTYVSPFVSYQFLVLKGYNKSMPVVPNTLIQVGGRIHVE